MLDVTINNKVFSDSDELENEILLKAVYLGPAQTLSNHDPDVPFTTTTLPVVDLVTTAINEGGKWK